MMRRSVIVKIPLPTRFGKMHLPGRLPGRQKRRSSAVRRIINAKERNYPEGYEPYFAYVTKLFNISGHKPDELEATRKYNCTKPKSQYYKLSGILLEKPDCSEPFT